MRASLILWYMVVKTGYGSMENGRGKILLAGMFAGFLALFLVLALLVTSVLAAPSGNIEVAEDNYLPLGGTGEVIVTFRNTADTELGDVASTIQFITLAAANLNPSRVAIQGIAEWEIWESEVAATFRASGSASATLASALYAPYSTADPVDIYTWSLGKPDGASDLDTYTDNTQFASDLRILRPGEILKLKITEECQNIVGDSRIWFFFQATEYEPAGFPVTDINTIPASQRMNLYYQDAALPIRPIGWWPLHNSYDPYDGDVDTGHAFEQVGSSPEYGWTRIPTTNRFAKSNKLVHQEIPVAEPCISITKDGPAEAQVGETVVYEFVVANCGNVELNDVSVDDPLLGGEIWSADSLLVGESENFTVEYTIQNDDLGPLENTAVVTGQYDAETVTESDNHSVELVVEAQPCVSITKDGPAEAQVGETVVYEFIVDNCGNVALTDVTVDDPLLGGEIWSADSLLVGESANFTVEYTVQNDGPGPLENTAVVAGQYDAETVTESDNHSVGLAEEASPCISITKDGPAEARVGETIVYHFVVVNCGNVVLTDVSVDDPHLGGEIWSANSLVVGQVAVFSVEYTIQENEPSPLVNTAVASGQHDTETANNSDDHSVIVESTYSFHLCGHKFHDLDEDGEYDVDTEPGMNGTVIVLLGPDGMTRAEDWYAYQGKFTYPAPETNPSFSGENQLNGSYCFNLDNVVEGEYTFYIKEVVPPGWTESTPTVIGPITLRASDEGPRESVHNDFGNKLVPVTGVPALSWWGGISMAALFAVFLGWIVRRKFKAGPGRAEK